MAYQNILYELQEPVAIITLNRPETLNAISPALEAELHAALDEADQDDRVRVIILTGAGRAFSSGYDISGQPGASSEADVKGVHEEPLGLALKRWWRSSLANIQKLEHLAYLGKPVIAAVNGWCMGGGMWYSLICDITIASDQAVFAQPEVRMISNTTFLLAALCGWKVASRYALTGDHIDAPEALRVGIVNEVVPHDQLMEHAMKLARRIALVPEPSVRFAKAVTFMGLEAAGLRSGMVMNAAMSALVQPSWLPERGELDKALEEGGMRAFLKLRDDKFRPEPFGPRAEPKQPS